MCIVLLVFIINSRKKKSQYFLQLVKMSNNGWNILLNISEIW